MLRYPVILLCLIPHIGMLSAADDMAGEQRGYGWDQPGDHDRRLIQLHGSKLHGVHLNQRGFARVRRHHSEKPPGVVAPTGGFLVRAPGRGLQSKRHDHDHVDGTGMLEAAHAGQLPPAVDNSQTPYFPPIFDQGSLNSCTSVAVTYYQLTHMAGLARGWDQRRAGPEQRFSPAWTFNLINSGNNKGSYQARAYAALMAHGAPTLHEFPYRGTPHPKANYRRWPTDPSVWRGALEHRVQSFGMIHGSNHEEFLLSMKLLLVNGHVLTAATAIDGWNREIVKENPTSRVDEPAVGEFIATEVKPGDNKHCITIVGYNDDVWVDIDGDDKVDRHELGALKIANSWGTGDWNRGFRWLHYSALAAPGPGEWETRVSALEGNQAFWMQAAHDYRPAMVLQLDLQSEYRDQVGVIAGVGSGDREAMLQNQALNFAFNFNGGRFNYEGGDSPGPIHAVLDLTAPLVHHAKPGGELLLSIKRLDGRLLMPQARLVDPIRGLTHLLSLRAMAPDGGYVAALPSGAPSGRPFVKMTLPAQIDLAVGAVSEVPVQVRTDGEGSDLRYRVFSGDSRVLASRDLSIIDGPDGKPVLRIVPPAGASGSCLLTLHASDGWTHGETAVRVNVLGAREVAPTVTALRPTRDGLQVQVPFRVDPGSGAMSGLFVFFDVDQIDQVDSYSFTGEGEMRMLNLRLKYWSPLELALSAASGRLIGTSRVSVDG